MERWQEIARELGGILSPGLAEAACKRIAELEARVQAEEKAAAQCLAEVTYNFKLQADRIRDLESQLAAERKGRETLADSDYWSLDHAMKILGACSHSYTGEQAQAVAKVLAQWQRKWSDAVDLMSNAMAERDAERKGREHFQAVLEKAEERDPVDHGEGG